MTQGSQHQATMQLPYWAFTIYQNPIQRWPQAENCGVKNQELKLPKPSFVTSRFLFQMCICALTLLFQSTQMKYQQLFCPNEFPSYRLSSVDWCVKQRSVLKCFHALDGWGCFHTVSCACYIEFEEASIFSPGKVWGNSVWLDFVVLSCATINHVSFLN